MRHRCVTFASTRCTTCNGTNGIGLGTAWFLFFPLTQQDAVRASTRQKTDPSRLSLPLPPPAPGLVSPRSAAARVRTPLGHSLYATFVPHCETRVCDAHNAMRAWLMGRGRRKKDEEDAGGRTDGRTDADGEEASYCGIIVVTTATEEERRTPLTHFIERQSVGSPISTRQHASSGAATRCGVVRATTGEGGRPEQLILLDSSAVRPLERETTPSCP